MHVIQAIAAIVSRCIDRNDDEDGQAMVEYALILVLIAVVAIAIMRTVGEDVSGVFVKIDSALKNE